MEKVTEKATNFKAASELLAKGLNFDDNAVVMFTAIKTEDGTDWDCSITQDGAVNLIAPMLVLYVSEFLKDLDEKSRELVSRELMSVLLRTGHEEEDGENA